MASDQQPHTVVIIKKGGLGCGGLILALFALGIVASVVVRATRGTPTTTPTQAVVTPATPGPGVQAAAVAVAPTYRRTDAATFALERARRW